MTDQHPITPPPELVQEWTSLANEEDGQEVWRSFARWAVQWGDDQRLLAVNDWIRCSGPGPFTGIRSELSESTLDRLAHELYIAMRPSANPLSETEQALAVIDLIQGNSKGWQLNELDVVRRALERLRELERGDG